MAPIQSIQYLRALAATMVVVFHCAGNNHALIGAASVDLFFVISDFVMWIVTAQQPISPLTFMVHRIKRIVPLCWLATLTLASAAALVPSAFSRLEFFATGLMQSLLFILHIDLRSGRVSLLLEQGWTLNYEIFFYAAIALALLLPVGRRLLLLFLSGRPPGVDRRRNDAQSGRTCAADLHRSPVHRIPRRLVARPLLPLGHYYLSDVRPSAPLSACLLVLGVAGFGLAAAAGSDPQHLSRVLIWGGPALLSVTGAVGLEKAGRVPHWPFCRLPATPATRST